MRRGRPARLVAGVVIVPAGRALSVRRGRPARLVAGVLMAAAAGGGLLAGCGASSPADGGGSSSSTAAACAAKARQVQLRSFRADKPLDSAWASYLASGSGWTGGDSVYAYSLPGGEGMLYSFSDSFVGGLIGNEHNTHQVKLIYHNLFVVRDPAGGFRVVMGGTAADPAPLVNAPYGKEFYVGLGGIVDGSTFQAIYEERLQTGTGSLDNIAVGEVIATFSLPGLHLLRTVQVPDLSTTVQWGSDVRRFGAYTYIYGASAGGTAKSAYVARVPGDDLQQPWSYWDGEGWAPEAARAATIARGVQSEYGVTSFDGLYLLLTSDTAQPFSPYADLYAGCSPEGPWVRRAQFVLSHQVGTVGQKRWGNSYVYVYDAMIQPALGSGPGDDLVVSFDRNSLSLYDVMSDARLYQPSYLELAISVPGSA